MKNLVYKDGMLPSTKKVFDALKKESNVRFEEMWKEHILYGNMGFRVDNVAPKSGKTVTFRKVDDWVKRAHDDGVPPELAFDHAKDMGMIRGGDIQSTIDIDRLLPPIESFARPLDIAEIRYHYSETMNRWIFTDDRNFTFNAHPKQIEHGATFKFMDREYVFGPMIDKLRRMSSLRDDRGVVYQIDLMARRGGRSRSYIPIRGVLTANWKTQDPNKQQGGAIMAQVKEATEKPIQQQPVKLGVYFRVNGLPQELSQKQVNEHVAKLLTLGAAEVNVQRYIRDETSTNYTNRADRSY